MKNTKFKLEEIPYDVLGEFGLSQEMIEDLPEQVLESVLDGRRSPVLPIHIVGDKGEAVHAQTRFRLSRNYDGSIAVVFYPELQKADISRFSKDEQSALLDGQAIMAEMETDGRRVMSFVQLDPETKQVLWVPTPVVGRNLEVVADMWELQTAELKCLQQGLPITVADGEELVTVGIDLNDEAGVRACEGDVEQWRREARRDLFAGTFGLNGCWRGDDEGHLRYIREDDYSEALLEEQRMVIAKRSQQASEIKIK